MATSKILFGVTGIGYGHTFRQIPVIEHFAGASTVVIFAYGRSLEALGTHFRNNPRVTVIPVAVPFFVGSPAGLDFAATARHPENKGVDFLKINATAMSRAKERVGVPSLVVSDYEPVSAQYAYATGAPLVTLDQQSKYLAADMPKSLGGFTYADEIERLRMFFPQATARLAISFFRVPVRKGWPSVKIFPPTIRDQIVQLKQSRRPDPSRILVYISSARTFPQSIGSVMNTLTSFSGTQFDLFVPSSMSIPTDSANISVHRHGDPFFYEALQLASGIITTAGHMLLSEAMFLEIPVFAIPVAPYEQFMNAKIVADWGFGISAKAVTGSAVRRFLGNRKRYAAAIRADRKILLRGPGQEEIIKFLESVV